MHRHLLLKIILLGSLVFNIGLITGIYHLYKSNLHELRPVSESVLHSDELPLNKYAFKNLRETIFKPQEISFGPTEEKTDDWETRLFSFRVEGKNVSGIAHIPFQSGDRPVIIMIRGYVDKEIYKPGVGSNPTASYFAKNGYITLAPDFLGYGTSDEPSEEPFVGRFMSNSTILQLIANTEKLNVSLENASSTSRVQPDKLGMWAHSNGGQIALSVLELSRQKIPTVLWAPVSKPFPYSVLYYTDEYDDNGKYLRSIISQFETQYDVEQFSLTNYLDWIQSPLQVHQGGVDDAVPLAWSDELYEKLSVLEKDVEYFTYPSADHNMVPDWGKAAQSSLRFFDDQLKRFPKE